MTLATEIRADFNFGFGITAGNTSPQRASLETKIHQIVALSGRTAPLQLVGNGNVFDRVHITGVNVQELDSYQTAVGTIDALQEVVV